MDTPITHPLLLLVSRKFAYGRDNLLAPENDTARLFCELLKQQNLTLDQIRLIRKLGFTVELAPAELDPLA